MGNRSLTNLIGMEIAPKTEWDLRRISIRTFTACVAGCDGLDGVITHLEQAGWMTISDISPWFMVSENHLEKEVSPIEKCILTSRIPDSAEMEKLIVCRRVWGTDGIGKDRLEAVKEMVRKGVQNILFSTRKGRFLPMEWRLEKFWKDKLFTRITDGGYNGGALCSDASKLACTTCAIVGEDEKLVAATAIGGRQTSHRGEAFGILIAVWLSDGSEITCDAKSIIGSVQKIRSGALTVREDQRMKNKSIIRCIAMVAGEKKVNIRWIKGHTVLVHTKDERMNTAADKQAKRLALRKHVPLIDECWDHTDEYFVIWKGSLYEGDIREKVMDKYKKVNKKKFMSTDRGRRFDLSKNFWVEEINNIDLLKYATFRFKVLTKTLPTLKVMRTNFPGLYTEACCCACEEENEDDVHLFSKCTFSLAVRKHTWRMIIAILAAAADIDEESVSRDVRRWIPTHGEHGREEWFDGHIPKYVWLWILKKRIKNKEVIWNCIHTTIWDAVHDIWTRRCDMIRKKGLTYLEKKRKMVDEEEFDWVGYWEFMTGPVVEKKRRKKSGGR